MSEQHPDPGGEAAARAAQLAAMTLSLGEAVARLRAQRANNHAEGDRRAAQALQATARTEAAGDTLRYRQALAPAWLRSLDTEQLLQMWDAALPHRDEDPIARESMTRVEDRLHQLHPEAMEIFDAVPDAPRDHRMAQASNHFRGPYGLDPVGTSPIVRAAATAQPAAGPRPDVVQEAFPVTTQEAMRTAPQAASRAVRAITAGPLRKQLTATPHLPTVQRSTR